MSADTSLSEATTKIGMMTLTTLAKAQAFHAHIRVRLLYLLRLQGRLTRDSQELEIIGRCIRWPAYGDLWQCYNGDLR